MDDRMILRALNALMRVLVLVSTFVALYLMSVAVEVYWDGSTAALRGVLVCGWVLSIAFALSAFLNFLRFRF